MFEKTVLKKIFGPLKDNITGWWRKIHNDVPHNSNSSPNTISVIKSGTMRWAMCNIYQTIRNTCNIQAGKSHKKWKFGKLWYGCLPYWEISAM